jgi:hypothetical protein
MLSKQDLKFEKPDYMSEDTYKYEWLRTYTAMLNQLLVDLGNVCDSMSCLKMIVRFELGILVYSAW